MPDDLYHHDILAWSRTQADRLRRLKGGERPNDLDWDHIIEEVEDLGVGQLNGVQAHLGLAMLHALKCIAWPESTHVGHWQQEIAAFLGNAQNSFQPGMQQHIDPGALYAKALKQIRKLPPIGGVAPAPLPEIVAFTAAELRNEDFGTTDLLDRIRAAQARGADA